MRPPVEPAVLFLAFNRPWATRQVFDRIREAKPRRLYIAIDGPRAGNSKDIANIAAVCDICSEIEWPCEVQTLRREYNLGCRKAVSGAIDWFFEHESEGIIVEDDCLPHPDFFIFCAQLLARYRDDSRVWAITGNNFQNGEKRGEASYYFSRYPHIWGWATWRRCWGKYDVEMAFWPSWRESRHFKNLFPTSAERTHWKHVFDRVYAGKFDTWDFQWVASVWRNNGVTATPQNNLVRNIGHGPDATHTKKDNPQMSIPAEPLGIDKITHPISMLTNVAADAHTYKTLFPTNMQRSHLWRKMLNPQSAMRLFATLAAVINIRKLRNFNPFSLC